MLLSLLYLAALGCVLRKIWLRLYVWLYNVLKVIIYPGVKLSLSLFYCSQLNVALFNKSFYYVLDIFSVFLGGRTYARNSECLMIWHVRSFDSQLVLNRGLLLTMYTNVSRNSIVFFEDLISNLIALCFLLISFWSCFNSLSNLINTITGRSKTRIFWIILQGLVFQQLLIDLRVTFQNYFVPREFSYANFIF